MSDERRVVLALDVDGVVLDPDRGGHGPWHREVEARFGITPDQLDATLFGRWWPEIIVGRRDIEPCLAEALTELGCDAPVEDVLQCWFEADCWPNHRMVEAAARWSSAGVGIVLATNQEHRRARYLRARLVELLPIEAMAYSARLGCTKAEPSFYERASSGWRAGHIVFVDDDARNVEVAAAAGWTALWYRDDLDWFDVLDTAVEAALRIS